MSVVSVDSRWKSSDRTSPNYSSTLLSILTDFSNSAVWTVLALLRIFVSNCKVFLNYSKLGTLSKLFWVMGRSLSRGGGRISIFTLKLDHIIFQGGESDDCLARLSFGDRLLPNTALIICTNVIIMSVILQGANIFQLFTSILSHSITGGGIQTCLI